MNASNRQLIAYGLVGLGIVILLLNSGILGALPDLIAFIGLLTIGGAFWRWSDGRIELWKRIIGFAGVGVFSVISLDTFDGSAALAFPATAFMLTYLARPLRWWPVIPAGVLASLATLVTFEELFPRWDATPILFLGFAATFAWLYLGLSKRWALFPAVVFIILTVLANDPSGSTPGWFLPFILIGSGLTMLWWWRKKS